MITHSVRSMYVPCVGVCVCVGGVWVGVYVGVCVVFCKINHCIHIH